MARATSLRDRVLNFIQAHSLLPQGELALVGVSGGPDSVCLLYLLAGLRDELGIHLHIAHLNHGLRGAESDADASYVSSLTQGLGLPLTVERLDVAAWQEEGKLTLEEAARQVRYRFFSQVASRLGASRVAVGHTADDQVETILLHLVRGSGLRGLQGMAPATYWPYLQPRPLWVIRPLLEVSRQDTLAYCQEQGLSPLVDISNYSPAYLRNRLRHQLLPHLESINPAIRKGLQRLGRAAAQVIAFLDSEVDRLWPSLVQEQPSCLALDRARLGSLPPTLQHHLLLTAWEKLRRDPQDLEAVHLEEALAALSRPTGSLLSLPGELSLRVERDWVVLGRDAQAPYPPLEGEHDLAIPGETRWPGWRVLASQVSPPTDLEEGAWVAYLDAEAAGNRLWVRARRPGDRFQPLGMAIEKKLQDFMVDTYIPRVWRDRIPLVVSERGILWVVGYRIGDAAKVTAHTQQALRLEFIKEDL